MFERLPIVLIVEDEFIIALDTADLLQRAGYDTVEASNADQAVSVLECRPNIGVVFTDVRMPGSMDGLKLAHYVRERWPLVKIIVTSGHHIVRERDLPAGGLFIAKPYSDSQLTQALRTVLA